jgi:hypothetical protein
MQMKRDSFFKLLGHGSEPWIFFSFIFSLLLPLAGREPRSSAPLADAMTTTQRHQRAIFKVGLAETLQLYVLCTGARRSFFT